MPDTLMTEAVREAYASAPDGVVLLHGLTLTHSAWTGSLDVVQDTQQHALRDEALATRTYLPVPFAFSLPEVSESAASEIRVELDTVPRDVSALLDQAVAAAGVITLTYRAWLSTDTSTPAYGPLTLTVLEATATLDRISLRATAADITNKAFPNLDYTPSKFPGLVA
jgi:hypothetical protein